MGDQVQQQLLQTKCRSFLLAVVTSGRSCLRWKQRTDELDSEHSFAPIDPPDDGHQSLDVTTRSQSP